ncbi:MAG: glycerol-3-phosphate dehydrogenase [Halocynthiibacter sp.]
MASRAHQSEQPRDVVDVFVIGGGINGCGIARDAAGRGLSVTLAEMGDLAQATSSASTKLFHGGLRYLEYFEVGLVRKALIEREVLLKAMPHISWPMRFVLPYHRDMRFENETPTSKLLSFIMPWMRGRRPAWLIRLGLFLYDHLGGRKILPPTTTLNLHSAPEGAVLNTKFEKAFEYSDCWIDDARLVVLNARDAQDRGATILTRAEVKSAKRVAGLWDIEVLHHDGQTTHHQARALINAGGPWVEKLLRKTLAQESTEGVRLVRGSHIITKKLFDHGKCYFFQGSDGRIIFAIPYEEDFTLIGTTDLDHEGDPKRAECTPEEQQYLCDFVSEYMRREVTREDIVWTFSGVRPLYDDGATSATAATRDYVLSLQSNEGAPLLSIFGGKITTYRRLAEGALAKLGPLLGNTAGDWTAGASLPGGDFAVADVGKLMADIAARYPFLDGFTARRMIRAYGLDAFEILNDAQSAADLGQHFGAGLYQREVEWMMAKEYACKADDVIWRRSKLGLRLGANQIAQLEDWMAGQSTQGTVAAQ